MIHGTGAVQHRAVYAACVLPVVCQTGAMTSQRLSAKHFSMCKDSIPLAHVIGVDHLARQHDIGAA
jgi:hypothetical protein